MITMHVSVPTRAPNKPRSDPKNGTASAMMVAIVLCATTMDLGKKMVRTRESVGLEQLTSK